MTARLDSHLADRMCEADFLWRTTFSDLFLPFAGVPGGTALPGATLAEDLDLLDKLTDEQFVDAALEFTCALPYDTQGAAALADAGAAPARSGPGRRARTAAGGFSRRLLEDPPRIRAWLRQFLEDCDEAFFAEAWSRLRHQLSADARHKTDLLRRKGLAEALTAVSPAVALDEAAGRITVDKLGQRPHRDPGRQPAARADEPGLAAPDGAAPARLAAGAALPGRLPRAGRAALRRAADPADDRPVPPGADAALPQSGPQRVHHERAGPGARHDAPPRYPGT